MDSPYNGEQIESGRIEDFNYVIAPRNALLLIGAVLFLMLIFGAISKMMMSSRPASLVTEIAAFILPAALVIQSSELRWSGVLRINNKFTLGIALLLPLLGASFAVSTSIFVEIAQSIWPLPEKFTQILINLMLADSFPEYIWVVVIVAAVPAFAEELVFRGIVQRSLVARFGPVTGIGLTALMFAVLHLSPWTFVPILIAGILFGYVAYRTGTVWASSLAHFGNNLIAIIALNSADSVSYTNLTEGMAWYEYLLGFVISVGGLILFEAFCRRWAVGSR